MVTMERQAHSHLPLTLTRRLFFQERASWVCDISTTVRLVTQSLFPPFRILWESQEVPTEVQADVHEPSFSRRNDDSFVDAYMFVSSSMSIGAVDRNSTVGTMV